MTPESTANFDPKRRRLEEVIVAYERTLDAGQVPDREELLRLHRDLTQELRAFFADHDAVAHAAVPLRNAPPPDEAATLPPAGGEATQSTQAGTVSVPGYEVLDKLGQGGMGVVYKARHLKLNRVVALKMILSGAHAGAADLERFRTEAEAIARLQHLNIVQVFEVGEHGGLPFFSLEFCPGGSLDRKLNATPLPAHEAAALVEELARGMQAAHEKGVIHRDLKPANVLFAEDGTPKITDFGLAKKLDEEGKTATGAIMGTPSYMAPEQAGGRSKEIGPACDVYALGAILYECLTGRPPFRAATPLDTILQVVSEEPVAPREMNLQVPRDLETICLKCLRKEPGRRYGSAKELAEDLRRFQHSEPIEARPVGRAERALKWARRHPAVAGLLGLVLAVTAIGFAATYSQYQSVLAESHQKDLAIDGQRTALEGQRLALDGERTAKTDAENKRNWALQELHRARSGRLTAQLLRVAPLWQKDPLGARALLDDLESCPLDMRDFAWGMYSRWVRPTARWSAPAPPLPRATRVDARGEYVDCLGNADEGDRFVRREVTTGKVRSNFRIQEQVGSWPSWCVSPDGSLLAYLAPVRAGGDDQQVVVRHTAKGELLGSWPVPEDKEARGQPNSASIWFTSEGQTLVVACNRGEDPNGVVTFLDARKGKPVGAFPVPWLAPRPLAPFPLCVSPKGDIFATRMEPRDAPLAGSGPREGVMVWGLKGREPIGRIDTRQQGITTGAFSPKGDLLALGDDEGHVIVWDVARKKEMWSHRAHQAGIHLLQLSPDGTLLLTATGKPGKGEFKLWKAGDGTQLIAEEGEGFAWGSLFHPREPLLVTPQGQNRLDVWDLTTGRVQSTLPLKGTPLGFSPDGWALLMLDYDELKLFDAFPGSARKCLPTGQGFATGVAFTPDGKLMASASEDHTVRLWDVATGDEWAVLRGHKDVVSAVAFSPDGKLLASASEDRTVRVWEVPGKKERYTLRGHEWKVVAVAFSPDGKTLASAGRDKTVRLWDIATGSPLRVLEGHTDEVLCVAFSPDGGQLAAGGEDQTVRVWQTNNGEPVRVLRGHAGAVHAVAYRPDGLVLASGSGGQARDETWFGEVKVWDGTTGQSLSTQRSHQGFVLSLAFSRDGKTLASGGDDRTVKLWDAFTFQDRATLGGHPSAVSSLAFAADDAALAAASGVRDEQNGYAGVVLLWEPAGGGERVSARKHRGPVVALAVSAEGQVASADGNGEVKLWEPTTGAERASFRGDGEFVFTPDARFAAGKTADGTFRLWEVSTGEERAALPGLLKDSILVARGGMFPAPNYWAVSPDGKMLASALHKSEDMDQVFCEIRLLEVPSGKLRATLRCGEDFERPAFSADGTLVAAAPRTISDGGTGTLWRVTDGQGVPWDRWLVLVGSNSLSLRKPAFQVLSPSRMRGSVPMALSPDGSAVVWADSQSGEALLQQSAAGNRRIWLGEPGDRITRAAFSQDSRTLVYGTADGTVRVWELARRPPLWANLSHWSPAWPERATAKADGPPDPNKVVPEPVPEPIPRSGQEPVCGPTRTRPAPIPPPKDLPPG